VLGDYRCGAGWCNALVRSTDAGKHFVGVGLPSFPTQGATASVSFANARDGFAYVLYGTGPLYVTHDGGKSWQAGPKGGVLGFGTGGGWAYVATRRHGIERSPVSHGAWRQALRLATQHLTGIAARGARVWLVGPPRRQPDYDSIWISTNHGRTFTTKPGPCFFDLGGKLESAGRGVVWAVCPTGMMAGLWRSSDDGASFSSFSAERRPLLLPNAAEIAASTPRDAVLSREDGSLLRTTDAGRHWNPVPNTADVTEVFWLHFTTARLGAAVVQTRHESAVRAELWRTTDGGATWLAVPIR
jgi:photosystem II stability/assembly factor-like uncharacterized protein